MVARATVPERARRVTARRAATRERLLEAARQVFAEQGIRGASVEDVCDAAGFTRGAFYSNFGSKDELFLALMRAEEERVLARLRDLVTQDVRVPEGADYVDVLIERFLAGYPIDRAWLLMHAEFWLHAARTPSAATDLNRATDRFRNELVDLVGVALQRAGRRLVVDPLDAVAALVAVVEGAAREALVRGGDAQQHALSRQVLPRLVRALAEPV